MRSIRSFLCVCVVALLFFNCDLSAQTMAKPAVVIQTGSMVAFDYTLTDESGTVIDSSKGKSRCIMCTAKDKLFRDWKKNLRVCPWAAKRR